MNLAVGRQVSCTDYLMECAIPIWLCTHWHWLLIYFSFGVILIVSVDSCLVPHLLGLREAVFLVEQSVFMGVK